MKDKLKPLQVRHAKPGKYSDGKGLYLMVAPTGARKWIYRFQIDGVRREMGLGGADDVPLSQARAARDQAAALVRAGIDPIEHREAERRAEAARKARLAAEESPTFAHCASEYIRRHSSAWTNLRHAQQWVNTLEQYANPIIGALPVKDIEQHHIIRILDPLWATRTETASRLRGRLERVLDWAAVMGYRSADNPARWRGRLQMLFPSRQKAQPTRHLAALPYPQVPEFMAALRMRESIVARALEFQILTGTRSGEARRAQWDEIDTEARVWTVPASRMKSRKPHRVPLSDRAVEIVMRMAAMASGPYVFSPLGRGAVSESGIRKLIAELSPGFTQHGFRSSFRDWASEMTAFPHEVCEQALAHAIHNVVERAYRRGDLFEKRRQLMDAWAGFCASSAQPGGVIPFRRSESM